MCKEDGCEREVLARGWCSTHYRRWHKTGTASLTRRRGPSECSIDECVKPVKGLGLCSTHYARVIRTGSPERGRSVPRYATCQFDGCKNSYRYFPSENRKYCSTECYTKAPKDAYKYKHRTCEHCGTDYFPTGPVQKYCSDCAGPTGTTGRLARLKKYGITHAEWIELLARHGGKCWICRDREATCTDHCHDSGRVRGALCHWCNSQLGAIERDGWLESALDYLRITGETP